MSLFISQSLPPLVIGILASVLCALPGNFLLLRRQALIGDAISHVVLPGIVLAFLVTGTVAAWPMLLGAAAAALVAVLLIEVVRRVGHVEAGAAMGVVFTTLFAGGVLLLELSDTSTVHLDVEHALYGNLESLIWLDGRDWSSLSDLQALAGLPAALGRLAVLLALVAVALRLAWRPLVVTTFDPGFARSVGVPVTAVSAGLVATVAAAAVASFEAVGSIIVIAMFVCPPAAARLMTERLAHQVAWSVVFAAASAVLGFVLALELPLWLGSDHALSAAGMIATASGVILALAALFGPARRRPGQQPAAGP